MKTNDTTRVVAAITGKTYDEILDMPLREILAIKRRYGNQILSPVDTECEKLVYDLFKSKSPYYAYIEGIIEEDIIQQACRRCISSADSVLKNGISINQVNDSEYSRDEDTKHDIPEGSEFPYGVKVGDFMDTKIKVSRGYNGYDKVVSIVPSVVGYINYYNEDTSTYNYTYGYKELGWFGVFSMNDDGISIALEAMNLKFHLFDDFEVEIPSRVYSGNNDVWKTFDVKFYEYVPLEVNNECRTILDKHLFTRTSYLNNRTPTYFKEGGEELRVKTNSISVRLIDLIQGNVDEIIEYLCTTNNMCSSDSDEKMTETMEDKEQQNKSVAFVNDIIQSKWFNSFVKSMKVVNKTFRERVDLIPDSVLERCEAID